MIGIHLSGNCDTSFLLNILDIRITMIWMIFLNFEVLYYVSEGFDLNFPSYHHPFMIDKKSTHSILLCNHFGVTLT